jgi:hypothetical protein
LEQVVVGVEEEGQEHLFAVRVEEEESDVP